MLFLRQNEDKLFANFGLFLYPIFGPKNQNFQKMKKKMRRDIIILHTLRCLINVGVRIFHRNINHSFIIV